MMLLLNRGAAILGALLFSSFAPVSLAQFDPPQPEDFADWVSVVKDATTPLPLCQTVGVADSFGCEALCQAVEGGAVDVSNTRDVNQKYTCTCENLVACNDQPTCEQLTIQPGRVMEGCSALCGDLFTAVEDEVEYSGDIGAGNKDMTHFVMECRCDGEVECKDYLMFSDLAFPVTCDSLGITSDTTCDAYCASEGNGLFDIGGNYTENSNGEGTCDCVGTSANALRDTDAAQACTDIPGKGGSEACTLADPCPTQAPGSSAADWNLVSTVGALAVVGSFMLVVDFYN
jgi:hypothetical protein